MLGRTNVDIVASERGKESRDAIVCVWDGGQ